MPRFADSTSSPIAPPESQPEAALTPAAARAIQQSLRERLVLEPPRDFDPRLIGGADVSMERFGHVAYAGIVVIEVAGLQTAAEATATAALTFPYIPGLLSFRELPSIELAWRALDVRPDVLIFDGQGYAHPRRFGIACHGGVVLGVPSIGCAKSILVGKPAGELAPDAGSTVPLVDRGEVVGMCLRLRENARPVYVSAGHRMDLATAVAIVRQMAIGFREPETTRRAHRLVNELRKSALGARPSTLG